MVSILPLTVGFYSVSYVYTYTITYTPIGGVEVEVLSWCDRRGRPYLFILGDNQSF